MKTKLFISMLVLILLNLSSFSNDLTAQSITGKWRFSNGSETVEFAEKGIFRVSIENQGITYGIYELEKDVLHFIFLDMEQTFSYPVKKINQKELILFNPETNEQMAYNYLGKHEILADEIELIAGIKEPDEGAEDDYYVEEETEEFSADEPDWKQSEENWDQSREEEIPENTEQDQEVIMETPQPVETKYPSTVPSASNIAGTWQCKEINYTMILTGDHYFVRRIMADESVRDLYPDAQVSYGKYKFDGNKLTLLTFSLTISGEETIPVENLGQAGFQVPIDFYGEKKYQNWTFDGFPQLSKDDQTTLLSWTNYLKFTGQWRTKDEILKFMGDGIVFAGKPGTSGAMLVYSTLGNTLRVQNFGAGENEFIYSGTIVEFTKAKLVLKDNKDGKMYTYLAEGKPKLTKEEIAFYSKYLQMQHRTTMDIIDLMDGVDDWIWVEEKQ